MPQIRPLSSFYLPFSFTILVLTRKEGIPPSLNVLILQDETFNLSPNFFGSNIARLFRANLPLSKSKVKGLSPPLFGLASSC